MSFLSTRGETGRISHRVLIRFLAAAARQLFLLTHTPISLRADTHIPFLSSIIDTFTLGYWLIWLLLLTEEVSVRFTSWGASKQNKRMKCIGLYLWIWYLKGAINNLVGIGSAVSFRIFLSNRQDVLNSNNFRCNEWTSDLHSVFFLFLYIKIN